MSSLYLDPFSGVSGDMFLGLLLDLGLGEDELIAGLETLALPGWRLESRREQRLGIAGTRVLVHCEEQRHQRSWADIDRLLAESPLDAPVGELARRIFRRLGTAEARVHGVELAKVHFHEVGALDSIIDVVGAAIGLTRLAPQQIVCAPLPLGHGLVETAHGRYPLPAPATAELLRSAPVTAGDCALELVTPTGAAIVAEVARFGPLPAMTLERVGYGVGSRDLSDRPNLLRGMLGRGDDCGLEKDEVTVLECHLGDSNPEWLGALLEGLLAAGALDAGLAPLQMKKNRPGLRLTVVVPTQRETDLARLILRESSASGIRLRRERRLKLRRQAESIDTEFGPARVKLLFDGAELLRVTPEYESCRELAASGGRPLPEVYRLVERAAGHFFRKQPAKVE
jgi:pyridinium-3,5-bisthiocarboxylic acid mononucleotide nickel chelatase